MAAKTNNSSNSVVNTKEESKLSLKVGDVEKHDDALPGKPESTKTPDRDDKESSKETTVNNSYNPTVATLEDTTLIFKIDDFVKNYNPGGGNPVSIKITTLETDGALIYFNGKKWIDVVINQSITAEDIIAGKLAFKPDADENGTAYSQIGYRTVKGVGEVNQNASTQLMTINVTSVNDIPVVQVASNTVNEDATVSGKVSGSDVDKGESATLTYALFDAKAAPEGLTFNADGSYAFDASSYDSLAEGETLQLKVAFTATDVHGASSAAKELTITITGTNDAPVVEAASASVNENATVSGKVSGSDVDKGESATLTYALFDAKAAPEGLTFNADGSYAFDASSYDSLAEGETLQLKVAFTATDVHGASSGASELAITITGTNDAPVVEAASASLNEDATVSGKVSGSDVDKGESATLTYALFDAKAAPEGLTFNADGSYAFDASSYDSLAEGETLQLKVAFTATDVHGASSGASELAITITGTNDAPVVEAASASLNEDATLSGKVSGSDVDKGESATLTYALFDAKAAPEGLTFNADGSYAFDASSYDSLAEGETLQLKVAFTATDVHGASSGASELAITITGTNDAPVVEAASASLNEDATLSGKVSGSDVDKGESATLTYALFDAKAAPEGLTFNADGSYAFDASSYDSLAEGETQQLKVAFTATDVHGASSGASELAITITGTNDAPVVEAASASLNEDATLSGKVSGSDVDKGESATLTYALFDAKAAPEGLTFNADGSYAFDASSYDSLAEGETLQLKVAFTATDVHGASSGASELAITITGTNDAPVVEAASASVNEDATVSGKVSGSDVDKGESATLTYALFDAKAAPEGLTFNADGSYAFDASSYDSLAEGETLQLKVAFTATDVHGASSGASELAITITGTNDAPVITGGDKATLSVDENQTAVTKITASDVDHADSLSFSILHTSETDFTHFTVDGTGKVTFTSAPDYEKPGDIGANNSYVVDVQVSDSKGATAVQTLTVNVKNVAEGPVVADYVTESGDPSDTIRTGEADAKATSHDDLLVGNSSPNTFDALSGNDTVYGGAGNDTIHGGNNDDKLYGQADNDTIYGEDNNDTIYGGSGNDTIYGGDNNDLIVGGWGADSLYGGKGSDIFRFLSTKDTGDVIYDFSSGDDKLDFASVDKFVSVKNSTTVQAHGINYFADGSGNTVIWADTDGNTATVELSVTLIGVTPAELKAGDFLVSSGGSN